MASDVSAFSVILLVLAQNQACSDSKQDSRAGTCMTMLFRESNIDCCCWMPWARPVQCEQLEKCRWRIRVDQGQSIGEGQHDTKMG